MPRMSEQESPKIESLQNVLKKGGEEIVETAKSEVRVSGAKHCQSVVILGDPAGVILGYAREMAWT